VVAGLLIRAEVWQGFVFGLPIVLAGLYAGSHVHTGLSQIQMTRVIGALLLLSSLSVFVKAFS
jgi:uncharacterized membrane protein YfcA